MFSSGAIRIVIVTGTARILCGARSMHLSGVRPSVCLSVDMSVPARAHSSKPAAASLLLWARFAGDIDRLLRGARHEAGEFGQCHVYS